MAKGVEDRGNPGPERPSDGLEVLHPATRSWFRASFEAATDVQRHGWAHIQAGSHALLLAPTGSGKTLAAFLACIDRLAHAPDLAPPGVRVLYVSPLKALVYDIERNLRAPLVGVRRSIEAQRGAASETDATGACPRVAIRTGDTPQRERREQARHPAEILVTTPESLFLILGSQQRETLRTVDTIIVDEIHALAGTKRGAHLALSLERVAHAAERDPQRIGLSATARPIEEVARFLGGDRRMEVVDTTMRPRLDLRIEVPVPDMTRPETARLPSPSDAEDAGPGDIPAPGDRSDHDDPPEAPARDAGRSESILAELARRDSGEAPTSLWPAIHPELLAAIRAHRSTIVFVNSRGLCERLSQRLNELAGEELVRAHHGSLAHHQRSEIEESLKSGTLRAIVATSSLELGIDMGAVDLVLMVESPGATSRGLQRVGRAGHHVGEVSRGRILPKHRGDLLEATVVAECMRRGEVEPLRIPRNPLDVLAQQIVAMCGTGSWGVAALEALVRRTASFRDLSREVLTATLDMLSGRYPSTDFAELRPRIVWHRETDQLEGRRGANRLALVSGGTIPDRGLYGVHLGREGPRIGELDEEMVHETRAGQTVTLGASTWRVEEITRDRVVVSPAPGEIGKLPFWRGEGPGRPIELGRALGGFVRELGDRCRADGSLHEGRGDAEAWLREEYGLDENAARNLVDHVVEQWDVTGALPTDRSITLERFRDELGDWRVCILSPFGARVHAPWALAIESRLSRREGHEAQTLWSDDGIVLRFADAEVLPGSDLLVPGPEEVEDLVVEQLASSALFAGQFRENAARALLLPRRRPGARTPLWAQRLRAQNLLAVAREFPSFPIMLETYRACLQDVFDVPSLVALLRDLRSRSVRIDDVETRTASPFARSLVFAYTATYLYQGDMPVAERRAQALSLDRNMLRDLLGEEELRDLLDAAVIDETEAELQGIAPGYQASHADGLHDWLRRLGDLSREEAIARADGPAEAWLAELEDTRRVVRMKIGGEERYVAVEDAALYRDALGAPPPGGLPESLLGEVPRAIEQLVTRFARHRGPFVRGDLAARYQLVPAQVEILLEPLVARGRLVAGDFHPRGLDKEWCDVDVLRRLRRKTLARLRGEVAAVAGPTLARFLPRWHRIGGEARLDDAIEQLLGLPVSFAELEQTLLPARVAHFDPRMLDERGALGSLVWVGRGSLGGRDGRIALYRRDRVSLLADPCVPPDDLGPVHRTILEHLGSRGASFFSELVASAAVASQREVLDALWDLVWQGLVTNDTFAPLRALSQRRQRDGHIRRDRSRSEASAVAGRWSLVASLLVGEPSATERAHARASMLLERYGVVSRDVMALEAIEGGWSQVYPVFRAMEESGKLRRGHFVEGLSGAQFAFAGAVDELRSSRPDAGERDVQVLAACDPVNAYGAMLPWPPTRSAEARPRRAVGAAVVLVEGEPALYLEKGGRRVLSFETGEPGRRDERFERGARALRGLFANRRRTRICIERIDDGVARESPLAPAFLAAGFRADYKGLTLERSPAREA